MLHLVFDVSLEPTVLERIEEGDHLVFMGTSVQMLLSPVFRGKIDALGSDISLYALHDAMRIHGIEPQEIADQIEIIEYLRLVDLSVENDVIHSWS